VQVPVIHHDNTLDRCTNGHGDLWNYTFQEVAELDAGAHFGPQFEGERIPTLADLLECCSQCSLGLNLEVKHLTVHSDDQPTAHETAMEEELANVVCDTIEQVGVQPDQLVLSSFSRSAVAIIRRRLPRFECAFLVKGIPGDWADFVRKHGCAALNFDHTRNSREQIMACAVQLPVFSYTVNDAERTLELLSWGVSGVFTDFPDVMASAVAQAAASQHIPLERARRHSDPVPPSVPASPLRKASSSSFTRSKSWKELSLENVVEQSLRFSHLAVDDRTVEN
jgi:glycerophosphoryl diester phosphodiesterase